MMVTATDREETVNYVQQQALLSGFLAQWPSQLEELAVNGAGRLGLYARLIRFNPRQLKVSHSG